LSSGTGFAIFDSTPFYAEGGGQVGDIGVVEGDGTAALILDTRKNGKTFLHKVEVTQGKLAVGKPYQLRVNAQLRRKTAINHTATHLLHAALRLTLGDRVKQAGSLVDPNRLRFDFTYPKAVTAEELAQIEEWVNAQIREAHPVTSEEMAYDDAIKSGAMAFFDEKYGDRVRVIRVGKDRPVSVELCGGTHLTSSIGDISFFKILSEGSVASGVRRVEAITSDAAIGFLQQRHTLLRTVESRLGTADVLPKLQTLQETVQNLQRKVEQLELKVAQGGASQSGGGQLWEKKTQVNGLQLVLEQVPSVNPKILRTLVDQVRDKLKERTVVVLASEVEGKLGLCVGLSADLVGRFSASTLIQPIAKAIGGTGGGKPDFAQAGGTQPENLAKAFEDFKAWLQTAP